MITKAPPPDEPPEERSLEGADNGAYRATVRALHPHREILVEIGTSRANWRWFRKRAVVIGGYVLGFTGGIVAFRDQIHALIQWLSGAQ